MVERNFRMCMSNSHFSRMHSVVTCTNSERIVLFRGIETDLISILVLNWMKEEQKKQNT